MELLFVKELCGVYCFSMRFVILLEVLSTILLPGALLFIMYVLIYSMATLTPPLITFVVLAIMIGLPSILIIVVSVFLEFIP
jgi:chitin synthase